MNIAKPFLSALSNSTKAGEGKEGRGSLACGPLEYHSLKVSSCPRGCVSVSELQAGCSHRVL
jgi:hypothetical protein